MVEVVVAVIPLDFLPCLLAGSLLVLHGALNVVVLALRAVPLHCGPHLGSSSWHVWEPSEDWVKLLGGLD